ncbi:hypothetical protein PsorP6_003756 [Peronosclerospora sorghi]|uniref:Uncharacterized protein n=1 Tax=Peronosclerospora sorghi TaxID=230839 RepID=A0ACC0VMH0_9STRA|nr:hypothetical protein PsorP6_003756 [Peronosclerospora sorghi]
MFFFDRRKVYALLSVHGIPVPRQIIVNRDLPCGKQEELIEHDNYVEINDVRINKPFVEKPVNAEDHNVYIYYPTSAGGGSKRLFRKVGDRSSEFYPDVNHVRRDGSYIYEEFLNTQGMDVKVYTIGSSYGHAKARKSPVLDGRVLRDSAGKEVRYPVILNSAENEMARKVCLAFHQTRCIDGKYDEVKVKLVADLQELLDLVRSLIKAYDRGVGAKEAIWEVQGGDSFKKLLQMKRVLERWKFAGINREVQFKPHKSFAATVAACTVNSGDAEKHKVVMILKWGGDLTERSKQQGEVLGQSFRNSLYPVEVEEGGLLRLHSTLRHDLKTFTSDEGRVQMTAAAFAKGVLELEGDLTPIIVSLVTTLDREGDDETPLYMDETFSLMFERWDKIYRDFYSAKTDTFNLSKIPDVHDCIKYDLLHSSSVSWKCGLDLFKLSKSLARCYVSQEYGMDIDEKQSIGNRVSQALCAKIRADVVTVMSAPVIEQPLAWSSWGLFGSGDGAKDGTLIDLEDQDIEHHGYRLDPSYAKELRIKRPGTQCPSWGARIHDCDKDDEYNISLDQDKFSNDILKRMGISVNDLMTQRKYVFRESKASKMGLQIPLWAL